MTVPVTPSKKLLDKAAQAEHDAERKTAEDARIEELLKPPPTQADA